MLVRSRSSLSVMNSSAAAGVDTAKASSTSGLGAHQLGRPCSRPRSVWSSVEPGGISIWTWLKAGLSVGWKVIGRVREDEDGRGEGGDADQHRLPAVDQRPAQQDRYSGPSASLRRGWRTPLRLQEIGGEHRRDQSRDGEADQHRGDDGEAEMLEELAGDARHQADRQEHRDDRHGRGDHREADLVGGVDRRLIGALAHPHVADDILDLDDRVVDQHAGDQAQREQAEAVQREAHHVHEPEGRDRRERDCERRNEGGPPVAKEQEDDEDGEHRALDHRLHRRVILRFRHSRCW